MKILKYKIVFSYAHKFARRVEQPNKQVRHLLNKSHYFLYGVSEKDTFVNIIVNGNLRKSEARDVRIKSEVSVKFYLIFFVLRGWNFLFVCLFVVVVVVVGDGSAAGKVCRSVFTFFFFFSTSVYILRRVYATTHTDNIFFMVFL